MWPFKKKQKVEYFSASEFNFTQVDFCERFAHHLSFGLNDWIDTIPMNRLLDEDKLKNLPAVDAAEDGVYRIADDLSKIREKFQVPDDGVYCPVCHIANVDISNLRTPCPRCQRPLLAFNWS